MTKIRQKREKNRETNWQKFATGLEKFVKDKYLTK